MRMSDKERKELADKISREIFGEVNSWLHRILDLFVQLQIENERLRNDLADHIKTDHKPTRKGK